MRTIKDLMIPMRDGVRLATDLYLPEAEGRYPLVLMRTPYNKKGIEGDPMYDYHRYVESGYVIAVQDVRGTLASEGTINQNGANEHKDGYDTVEYLAAQPFCDGNVGMYGLSYFGFTQMAASGQRPPHLKCATPFMCKSLSTFGTTSMQTISTFHLGWAYGQLLEHPEEYMPDPELRARALPILRENRAKLGEFGLHLPMNENPAALIDGVPMLHDYIDLCEGVESKEFWESTMSPIDHDQIHTALLYGTGWMDGALNDTIDCYMASRRSADTLTRENARLLIGPWTHGGDLPWNIDGKDFGEENSGKAQDVIGMLIRFFDRYLKGEETDCFEGRVRYFMQNTNDWHTASDWPPPEAEMTRYYLSEGALGTELPEEGTLDMTYDPSDPAPSAFADSNRHFLTADWSEMQHKDVLRMSTEPLDRETRIAGLVKVTLFADTDVPDTDFAARLTDIAPDGYERLITQGLVRARHRNGLFTCDFLNPGEVTKFEFPIGNAGYALAPGHRLGLHIAGSMFPAYNRNLNTTEAPSLGKDFAVAHDHIHVGGVNASYVEVPLI